MNRLKFTSKGNLTPAEEKRTIQQAINLLEGMQRHKRIHENCECLADIWNGTT